MHQTREYPEAASQPARENDDRSPEGKPDIAGGPAVQALINQARAHREADENAQAAATLERALRIEPRNPFVYAELAEVMLAQELPDEAENLARRSNSLADRNPALQARNWTTIAGAMRARGDQASADAAERRAQQLRNLKR